jgi:uncharacterized protein YfdQ (DUF2303 family)
MSRNSYGGYTADPDAVTEASVIADLAMRAGAVQQIEDDGIPFYISPKGEAVSLEAFLSRPPYRKGTVQLGTLDSFVDYVNEFKAADSMLFADPDANSLVCIFDFHESGGRGKAGRGVHRATFSPKCTTDWFAWTGANKKTFGQVEFAEFIEDNLRNIVEPTAADMLELAQTIEAKKNVSFNSSTRLSNGQTSLEYVENVEARGKGDIAIPNKIVLGLAVYEGGEAFRVDARFRFRLKEGKISFEYLLDHPDEKRKVAFADLVKKIETGVGTGAFTGKP